MFWDCDVCLYEKLCDWPCCERIILAHLVFTTVCAAVQTSWRSWEADKMTTRYDSIIRSYGQDGFEKIQSAKILVVGAGGIGCEVGIRLSILCLISPYCMLDLCNFPCRY
jgi:hypothetical protein